MPVDQRWEEVFASKKRNGHSRDESNNRDENMPSTSRELATADKEAIVTMKQRSKNIKRNKQCPLSPASSFHDDVTRVDDDDDDDESDDRDGNMPSMLRESVAAAADKEAIVAPKQLSKNIQWGTQRFPSSPSLHDDATRAGDDDDDDDDAQNDTFHNVDHCFVNDTQGKAVRFNTIDEKSCLNENELIRRKKSEVDNHSTIDRNNSIRGKRFTTNPSSSSSSIEAKRKRETDLTPIVPMKKIADELTQQWNRCMNNSSMNQLLQNNAKNMSTYEPPIIYKSFDKMMSRSCWSLLTMIDVSKCTKELRLSNEQARDVTISIENIRNLVTRICKLGESHDIAVNIQLARGDNVDTFSEEIRDNDVDNDSHPAENQLGDIHNVIDDAYDALASFVHNLDDAVHKFLLCCAIQRAGAMFTFLKQGPLTTINSALNESYRDYVQRRVRYSRFDGSVHKLGGYFLVSLVRAKHNHLRFEVLEDRSKVLQSILAKYIAETFLNDVCSQAPIYLNISERRDILRLNVLSIPDIDEVVELALIELANVSFNAEKRFLSVKCYISMILTNQDK